MAAQMGEFFRRVSIAAFGFLTGAGLAVALTEYPGVFEVRFSAEESFLKMDGSSKCDLVAQSVK
jgi:hypothetical protein